MVDPVNLLTHFLWCFETFNIPQLRENRSLRDAFQGKSGPRFYNPYTEIEDGRTPTPPNKKWMGIMWGSLELGLFCLIWSWFDDFFVSFCSCECGWAVLRSFGFWVDILFFGARTANRAKSPLSVGPFEFSLGNSHLPVRKVKVKQTTW